MLSDFDTILTAEASRMKANQITFPFTVDVEDGINIAMRDHFNIEMEPTRRGADNTARLLDLFAKYDVKTTFFILGQIATSFPDLVKRIEEEGHEVAVHGYDHVQFFKLTPLQLKEDLYRAKNTIEGVIGKEVGGFRAPAFSVIPSTAWALNIIAEMGFKYDSSIMPAKVGRYGWPGFSEAIQRLHLTNGLQLIEVPLTVTRILGRSLPVGGGGYLRLFPFWFTRQALRKRQNGHAPVVYIHPYEIDTQRYPEYFYQALKASSLKKQLLLKSIRFRKETVMSKVEKLLNLFTFDRMDMVLANYMSTVDLPETVIDG